MNYRRGLHLVPAALVCAILLHVIPCTLSCIYLLNGWTPMSVYNRTAHAPIVISANVIRTYKQFRTDAQTYTAKVKILDVYKGEKLLRTISARNNRRNITNFGDRKMCYADVQTGDKYIFFLTTYKQRLSAKYDDIFGAVAKYTEYNVRAVLDQVGAVSGEAMLPWSEWSQCSASCERGYQTRQRRCGGANDVCDGDRLDRRQCNNFGCEESRDLLSYLGVYSLPPGVSRVQDRHGAYNISARAKLSVPFHSVFTAEIPKDFSILFSIYFPKDYSGYFWTLSDLLGEQRLALMYSKTNTLEFAYYDQYNLAGSGYDIRLAAATWHQVAISVEGRSVQVFVDCDHVLTDEFNRSEQTMIETMLIVALGPYFARYGTPFEGLVEQLVITPDAGAAAQQCSVQYDTDQAIKDDGDIQPDVDADIRAQVANIKLLPGDDKGNELPAAPVAVWTDWSECSESCGRGVQSRTRYCSNNRVADCLPGGAEREDIRWCFIQPCQSLCSPACSNGGRCVAPGTCACPVGYTGSTCEAALCEPACKNGGSCLKPGYCSCPYGYMPPTCDPICVFPCRNGGRCVRHNRCKCPGGYGGKHCTKPVCRRGCSHGGQCVSPNTCSCPPGYSGSRCQKAACKRSCQNGGTCAGHNRCVCAAGYRGRWCHKKRRRSSCKTRCYHGGKCRKSRCRCKSQFFGDRCEKRRCRYETYTAPYRRTFRQVELFDYVTACGTWSWKTCVKSRRRYVTKTKTVYRTAYRCVVDHEP